jgi:dihydrofolate reductase/thymidylate synthase
MFNIIIAIDNKGGIGNLNSIPWKFKKDVDFFSNLTKKNTILPIINTNENILIMGYNTYLSLKSTLKNRIYYVITNKIIDNEKNVKFFNSFIECYNEAKTHIYSDIWVIGGAQIYNIALKHYQCNKVYITYIDGIFETDTFLDLQQYNFIEKYKIETIDTNLLDGKQYLLYFTENQLVLNAEMEYLKILDTLLNYGNIRDTRNGPTISNFNKTISWDLNKGFPLFTTKKMYWKGIVEELLFFIRGDTDTNILSNQGIKIWEGNTNKNFLNNINLKYKEGFMGPMYGYQWRFFNKPYLIDTSYNGVDQLKNIINEINDNPHSRRLIMTTFNPIQVNMGVLYPCHSIIIQFYIDNNLLSCNMYQRSGDMFLGVPFNIASTSLLVHIVAKLTNLNVGNVNLILGDYHIYQEHINQVIEQLNRIPYNLPNLIMKNFETLEQVENSTFNDYQIENYNCHPSIKAMLVV